MCFGVLNAVSDTETPYQTPFDTGFDNHSFRGLWFHGHAGCGTGGAPQVECFVDLNPRPNYQFLDYPDNRSWCLGSAGALGRWTRGKGLCEGGTDPE